ncbi:MAG TPA: trans-aconitate 2-methyltransferase [Kineosporiaceae bacterium]|nr:trans-aconitate 2-methyltransferase [Kineosporiaceae bacterium]
MRWDPEQYLRYADERARPFLDLLARVDARAPQTVADLGCGPGTLTRVLAERWPSAQVEALDSSPDMVARARRELAPLGDRVDVTLADLRTWQPVEPLDVLVSNATLQWVPDHLPLLDAFAGYLAPGGWLAVQVPGNFGEPSHALLRDLAGSPRWHGLVGDIAWPAVAEPSAYLTRLAGRGLTVDAWETTYLQVLPGPDAVLEWMRGTGLRPVLTALEDDDERAAFEAEYGALLDDAYPRQPFGTVLPYRRIFLVARRD